MTATETETGLHALRELVRQTYAQLLKGEADYRQVVVVVDAYRTEVAKVAKAHGRRWQPSRAQVLRNLAL